MFFFHNSLSFKIFECLAEGILDKRKVFYSGGYKVIKNHFGFENVILRHSDHSMAFQGLVVEIHMDCYFEKKKKKKNVLKDL